MIGSTKRPFPLLYHHTFMDAAHIALRRCVCSAHVACGNDTVCDTSYGAQYLSFLDYI